MNQSAVISFRDLPGVEDPVWLLEDVVGLTILERNLMTLKDQGVTDVAIIGNPATNALAEKHLLDLCGDPRLPETKLYTSAREIGHLPPLVLVLDGSRVFHPGLIQAAALREETCSFALGGQPAGIEVVEPSILWAAGSLRQIPKVAAPQGTFAQPVDSQEGRRKARRLVLRSLIKATDGWFSVHLNRPVSLGITRFLVRFPIHPNLVTLFTLLVGIASGAVSALGSYWGFAIGGVLYQLASILDGVDGEIARVKFKGSRSGQWMDTICDDLTNAIYIAGVTIGAWNALGFSVLLWLGIAAVALDVLTVSIMYWQLLVRFHSGTLLGFQWDFKKQNDSKSFTSRILYSFEPWLKRDGYAVLFMIFALSGVTWLVLPFSAAGLSGTLAVVVVQVFRAKRSSC